MHEDPQYSILSLLICPSTNPSTYIHRSMLLHTVCSTTETPPAGTLSGGGRSSKSWMLPGPAGLFFKGPRTPSVNPPPFPPGHRLFLSLMRAPLLIYEFDLSG